MTYKGKPLRECDLGDGDIRTGSPHFSQVEAGLAVGKMPHEWRLTPRWSRLATVAALNVRRKLDLLALRDTEGESKNVARRRG